MAIFMPMGTIYQPTIGLLSMICKMFIYLRTEKYATKEKFNLSTKQVCTINAIYKIINKKNMLPTYTDVYIGRTV